MAAPTVKIKAQTADEICKQFPLSDAGKAKLAPGSAPLAFLEALEAAGAHPDAIQFLAYALPKREAVWWSSLCARDIMDQNAPADLLAAVEAAETWVRKPTEESRRKAEKAGNAVKDSHPARWSAMAAFWSSGSLAPEGAPEVKCPEDFTAKAVTGAVLLAAGADPQRSEERNKLFVAYGLDIAKGGTGRAGSGN